MKRFLTTMLALTVSCFVAVTLCSCEAIGLGSTGDGRPIPANPKVSTPAIGEEGVLRVGVDASNAPFSTLVGDKLVGIDVDIAAALADELGVAVKVVDVGTDLEASLEAGTVDIVMGMDVSDSAATCWLSDPYLPTAVAIFSTSSGAILPTADSKPSIEAQESSMSAWEITNQFGDEALKPVSDLRTAFEDLEGGSATYVAADAVIGSYVSHTSDGNAMIIGLMQRPGGYCIGVPAANNDLKPVISDAVAAIAEKGIVSVVEAKWIGQSINMDSIALTEAASKADAAAAAKRESTLGAVGTNAVSLEDDGSTGTGNDAPVVSGDWTWTGAGTGTTDVYYGDATGTGAAEADAVETEQPAAPEEVPVEAPAAEAEADAGAAPADGAAEG